MLLRTFTSSFLNPQKGSFVLVSFLASLSDDESPFSILSVASFSILNKSLLAQYPEPNINDAFIIILINVSVASS